MLRAYRVYEGDDVVGMVYSRARGMYITFRPHIGNMGRDIIAPLTLRVVPDSGASFHAIRVEDLRPGEADILLDRFGFRCKARTPA